MRKLSLLLSLVSLLLGQECFGASTTNAVLFYNRDFQINPQSTRQNFVYFLGAPGVSGTNLITRDRIVKVSNSNGYFGLTNYVPGSYRVEHQGTYAATTNYFIFPDTNGVISAADWIVNAVSTTTPSSSPFVLNSSGNATNLQLWGTALARSNAKLQFGSQVISNNLDDGALTFWDVGNGIGAAINGGIFYGDGSELTNLARVAGGNVDIVYSTGLSATTNGHRVTVTGTGTNSSSSGTSFTNSVTLWVDPLGNNTTAVRGVRELPWSRPDFAITNAQPGDTVFLMPGSYVMSNACRMPTNGAVIGSGQESTIVYNYYTNAGNLPIPVFALSDNSRLADLSIRCGHMGQAIYQSAFGTHRNVFGAYSNAIVENITADGETDIFYIDHSNRTYTTVINLRAPTNAWDVIALKFGAHRVDMFNPYVVSTNVSAIIPNQNHFLNLQNSVGSIVNVYGGYIRVGNSLGRIVSSIGAGVDARFYNSVLTNAAATWFNMSTDDYLTLQGTYAPQTSISTDLDSAGLTIVPVLTTNIAWGGDADHGAGPVMIRSGSGVSLNSAYAVTGRITNSALAATKVVFTDGSTPPALTSTGVVAAAQGGTGLYTNNFFNTNLGGVLYLADTNTGTWGITTNNAGTGRTLHRATSGAGSIAAMPPYWDLVNLSAARDVTGALPLTSIAWGDTLSSSRMILTDSGLTTVESAAASGAVPIDANGTATTFAQVNALAPGNVLTNGESVSTVFSNTLSVDVTHNLVASNGIYSQFSFVTNTPAGSYVYMTNGSITLSNFQTGGFIRMTNDSIGITNGANFVTITNGASTNSGSVQAANFVAPFVNNATVLSAGSGSSGFNVKARNDAAGNITINRFDNTAMFAATPSDFSVAGTLGFGSASLPSDVFFTRDAAATAQMGADAATPTAQVLKGPDGSGTDKTGGDMTFAGGKSTGTGRGGAVKLQTSSSATSTGSSANTLTDRLYISAKRVDLTESTATLVFNVAVASGKHVGLRVFATTDADNGTDFQSTTDGFTVAAVNKAGTVTTAISSSTTASAASSGTLTTTWTAVANGSGVDLKNNAVSSLTQTTLATRWRVEIDSDDVAMAVTPQ